MHPGPINFEKTNLFPVNLPCVQVPCWVPWQVPGSRWLICKKNEKNVRSQDLFPVNRRVRLALEIQLPRSGSHTKSNLLEQALVPWQVPRSRWSILRNKKKTLFFLPEPGPLPCEHGRQIRFPSKTRRCSCGPRTI